LPGESLAFVLWKFDLLYPEKLYKLINIMLNTISEEYNILINYCREYRMNRKMYINTIILSILLLMLVYIGCRSELADTFEPEEIIT
jgi:hypothetical protein